MSATDPHAIPTALQKQAPNIIAVRIDEDEDGPLWQNYLARRFGGAGRLAAYGYETQDARQRCVDRRGFPQPARCTTEAYVAEYVAPGTKHVTVDSAVQSPP